MPLRQGLKDALVVAMKSRDRTAASVLRTTLAAIDNAGAVAVADAGAQAVELTPVGVGATEVPRRDLTEDDVEKIVRAELAERRTLAADYARAGKAEQAERFQAEADVLAGVLG
ncbi:Yqey-like protein [Actinomadura rubteroloni]|uniref:Yqey-like protein n=1 Tax=Actinomadura rubteroloni TaxID=1926885 RepID=A0A2P4UN07_9ACTN|nr:GatB/YqeY domain-containing protein [Actinomadura rubteroloni]POM26436.1 Yqey-like protein [Actinomadura rubteroloni]